MNLHFQIIHEYVATLGWLKRVIKGLVIIWYGSMYTPIYQESQDGVLSMEVRGAHYPLTGWDQTLPRLVTAGMESLGMIWALLPHRAGLEQVSSQGVFGIARSVAGSDAMSNAPTAGRGSRWGLGEHRAV